MRYVLLLVLFLNSSYAQKGETSTNQERQSESSSKSANDLWVFAEGLFARTWYKDALAEYESFLIKFPEADLAQNARWRLYECYGLLKDKFNESRALLDYIKHEKNPIHRERAKMNQARLLFEDEEFAEALKVYGGIDKKLDKGSLWENASYESARIYLRLAKPGEAFLRFRQLAALPFKGENATRAYAIFAYASLLVDREKYEDAIKQYNRLTLHKKTDPLIAENAWFSQGSLYLKISKPVDAKRSFQYIIENYPQGRYHEQAVNQAARCELGVANPLAALQLLKLNEDTSGEVQQESSYLTAFAYQQLKKYDEALKYYELCLESKEDAYREESWFNKLNCLSASGKSLESLGHAKNMIKLYPESSYMADVCYTAGLEAEKIKDYEISITFFKKAISSFVGTWTYLDSAYFAMARVLRLQKKYSAEAAIWEELSLRSNSEYRSTAFVRGAEVWVEAGKSDKALVLLKKFLQVFPEDKQAFFVKNRIVEIQLVSQQYKAAAAFLVKMLSEPLIASEKATLQSVLGRVYYYQEEYGLSVEILEECLRVEQLSEPIKSDCLVFLGFSNIALEKESAGVKALASTFDVRTDFSSLLTMGEESDVAGLLEKYNYNKAAAKTYKRLSSSKNKKIKMNGLLGQARLAVVDKMHAKGLVFLKQVLELCAEKDNFERVSALSLMGEIYLFDKKLDQAYQTFEFARKIKSGDDESVCRILYGMASILKAKGEFEQARRYANQVFILYKDPFFAPRAMFLSIQSSSLSQRKTEASQTAVELKKKFPLYFAKNEVQDYLKEHGINPN
jgi:tetratricopeptide (TPR) repeat protein